MQHDHDCTVDATTDNPVCVGAYEAKTHLAKLLDRVSEGQEITITRHGVPVARLVPAHQPDQRTIQETCRRIREFGEGRSLGGITIRELIDEGRTW